MPVLEAPELVLEPAIPPFPVRRWTVQDYHDLIRKGAFSAEERVELLNGWIVDKMPHSYRHRVAIELAEQAIRQLLPQDWRVSVQFPITTADSEPEPDIAIVRGQPRDYLRKHPGSNDIGMVVEVADTSLARDREKAGIYARAGILCYCIVNLEESCLEVHTQPSGKGAAAKYMQREVLRSADTLQIELDGTTLGSLTVADMLPEVSNQSRKRRS